MILTAANMLDWMGVEDCAAAEAANQLRQAVEQDLDKTYELARSTSETGRSIVAILQGALTVGANPES